MFAHQDGSNTRGEATKGWGLEERGVGSGHWSDCREGMMGCGGRDVVPGARVGKFCLERKSIEFFTSNCEDCMEILPLRLFVTLWMVM